MTKSTDDRVPASGRRDFLKSAAAGAATGAAALVGGTTAARAQQDETVAQVAEAAEPAAIAAPGPTEAQLARDEGDVRPPAITRAAMAPGSDLMVDVLRDLGIEYVASNPGSSFEGLQESIINHGNPPNRMPEFITALHEMSAVDMAHGYAKAAGKPMAALIHGVIGLTNGTMGIYQAYYDQAPVVLLVGRDNTFIQAHTADDIAGLVRSFTKWDAHPKTLEESFSAIQEAYRRAMTPPCAPTLVVLDTELQKEEAPGMTAPPAPEFSVAGIDSNQAREIARGLLAAQNPRINVGRLRTPEGVAQAVELAELVGACTSSRAANGPNSFPNRHPLCGPGAVGEVYDYVLGLEAPGAQTALLGPHVRTITDRDPTDIGLGGNRLMGRGFVPITPPPGENNIDVDAEASLAAIIEEVRREITAGRRREIEQRSARHAEANRAATVARVTAAAEAKRAGWNGSPIATARVYADLWPLIEDEDWCLSSGSRFSGAHHADLWALNKPYSFLGSSGAGGIGYGLGASVGAGLAAKERGRFVINIQNDGDINYCPGGLWTATHHKLPILSIMHNNRAWHQELMFVEYMTGVRGRGTDRGHIGTTLRNPYINYAKMAEAYGMAGEGPIEDPDELVAAYRRGIETVKGGEPYLIDVITQPR